MPSKSRQLSRLITGEGVIKTSLIDSDALGTSASKSVVAASGTSVYSSADTLPTSASNGDQALVTSTNRLYVFTNGGWYNIALINSTPYWSSEASSSYELNTDATVTTITLLAVDSEGIPITYTATTDSDFDNIATISKDSDNGRTFTIVPIDSDGSDVATGGSGTVTFKASDGVNVVSTLSTFSIEFQIANSSYTSFLLKTDSDGTDNQVDASSIGRTITEGGNITSSAFTPYAPGGYSAKFDGSGDSISITHDTTLKVASEDFTFECWWYPTVAQTSKQIAGDFVVTSYPSNCSGWDIILSGGIIYARWGAPSYQDVTTSTSPVYNSWNHIVFTRNSNTIALFLNGNRIGSSTSSITFSASTSANFYVGWAGSQSGTTIDPIEGYIRDARLVKGTAVYDPDSTTLTVPTEPLTAITNTSLLCCHLPYFADGSTNDHTITVNGNTANRRFGPYNFLAYNKTDYGGAVLNDGAGDYMTVPADTTHLTMAGDFTIDFWYFPAAAKTNGFAYGKWNNNSDGWAIFLTPNWSSGNLGYVSFYYGNYGTNESATSLRSSPITLNAWHYIRIVRSSGVFYMSVNGKVGTRSNYGANGLSWSDTRTFNANTVIGITGNTSYNLGLAFMSDFRVIVGTALTTGDFTPPTAPVSAVTNTKILTCTNKNSVFDGIADQRSIALNGNATVTGSQSNFVNESSVYFDGSGDYVSVTDGRWKTFGSDDFTIEGWFRADALGGTRYILGDGASNGQTSTSSISICTYGSNLTVYGWIGSLLEITGSTTLSAETWYHFALTRSGSNWTLWLNGSSDATYTSSASVNDSSTAFAIGRTGEYDGLYFAGYIQDVRVTKGLARYTSTFTPPTSTFKG